MIATEESGIQYLRNCWYAAAWSEDLGDKLLARTLLGEPVVMLRRKDGQIAALQDRCPHRFAPLSLGERVAGDVIQCRYHGLEFGADGRCVRNPHSPKSASGAIRVPIYKVQERHSIIWIWMGEDEADANSIPDFSCLGDPLYTTIRGTIHVEANYELVSDNLMDLSHAAYLHKGTIGDDSLARGKLTVFEQQGAIISQLWIENELPTPVWDMHFNHYGKPVDHWLNTRWNAPANMLLDAGVTPTGKPKSEGVQAFGTNLMTPETGHSTHYLWAASRNFMREPEVNNHVRAALEAAFVGQDKPMIEAVQRRMGMTDFDAMKPLLLASDAGAVMQRRRLKKLVSQEQKRRQEAAQGRGDTRKPD
jgi:phenylpropionate dioxygenase-like ring-hydroxylating dioxygenase large terminal subunit